ncbi:hypothetical protein N7456_002154 [Penicillium angulare]|uniref:Uncharacterized protein n=1 Tax=Penicillium angulare TaxID=116970 RepID=A0A9W9G7K4_9EURO|nr:hypothetical protein N7456_002154 [Penicillium angulare]
MQGRLAVETVTLTRYFLSLGPEYTPICHSASPSAENGPLWASLHARHAVLLTATLADSNPH